MKPKTPIHACWETCECEGCEKIRKVERLGNFDISLSSEEKIIHSTQPDKTPPASKCKDNHHDMVWKCRKCDLVVDSKHSHKTCIEKFDQAEDIGRKETLEEVKKLFEPLSINDSSGKYYILSYENWKKLGGESK